MDDYPEVNDGDHDETDILALCDLVDEYRSEIVYASEELVTLADELALANTLTEVQTKKLTASNALVVDLEDSICVLDDELVELRSVVETIITLLTIRAPDKDLVKGLRFVLSIEEENIGDDTETTSRDDIAAISSIQENKFIAKYKAIIKTQLVEIANLKEKIKVLEKEKANSAMSEDPLEGSPVRDRILLLEGEKLKNVPGSGSSSRFLLRESLKKKYSSEYKRKEDETDDRTPHAPPRSPSYRIPPSSSLDNSFERGRAKNKDSPKNTQKNIPRKSPKISVSSLDVRDSETVEEGDSETEDEDEDNEKDIKISLPYRRGSKGDISNVFTDIHRESESERERKASRSNNYPYPEIALSPTARMKYDGVVKSSSSSRKNSITDDRGFERPIGSFDRTLDRGYDEKSLEKELNREINEIEKEKEKERERNKRRKRDSIPLPERHRDHNGDAKTREREREREDREWEREQECRREPERISREEGKSSSEVPVSRARKGTRGNAAITDALKRVRASIITTRGTPGSSNSNTHSNESSVRVKTLCVTSDDESNPLTAQQINEFRNSRNIDNEMEVRAREQQYLHQQWLETSSNSPPRHHLNTASAPSSSSISVSVSSPMKLTPLSPPNPNSVKPMRPLHFSRPVLRMDCENAFFDVQDLRHSEHRNHNNHAINTNSSSNDYQYQDVPHDAAVNKAAHRIGKSANHGM